MSAFIQFKDVKKTYKVGDIEIHASNGVNFEVSLPLKNNNLNSNNLYAYYIDDNGNIEEHKVKVDDFMAQFETTHFSTYIIGGNAIKNPATSDSFVKLLIAFLISLFGFITTFIYVKKIDKQ